MNCNNPECNNPACTCDPCECTLEKQCISCVDDPEDG